MNTRHKVEHCCRKPPPRCGPDDGLPPHRIPTPCECRDPSRDPCGHDRPGRDRGDRIPPGDGDDYTAYIAFGPVDQYSRDTIDFLVAPGHPVWTTTPDVVAENGGVAWQYPDALHVGQPYSVRALVRNLGNRNAVGTVVRFWHGVFTAGGAFDPASTTLIGQTTVDIPRLNLAWAQCPDFLFPNRERIALLVDASVPGEDPVEVPFDPIADRHVTVFGLWKLA